MGDPAKTSLAARSANQPDPLLGREINGRFKVLSVIARGGMGKVYRAEQAPLGRVCALKVLHPNYQGDNDPEFHKRFFLEASVASRLRHPNTVTIYDYGQTDDGVYFMAMELLEGRTLHRLIREEAPLDGARAAHILLQTCRSLREAHGHGVIHRDLKPANIFLIHHDDDPDYVKVLDFGLVKSLDETNTGENLTQTGLFMGSPKYMAPEQIRGERVSAATDVYALGVVLYEMLSGKVPFDRPNSVNLLMAHVSEPVPAMSAINPSAHPPPELEDIVYRCLSKRPEDRYGSMDEFIAALKHAGTSLGVPFTGTTGTGEHAGSFVPPPLTSSGETAVAALRESSGSARISAISATGETLTDLGGAGHPDLSPPPPFVPPQDAPPVESVGAPAEITWRPRRAVVVGTLAAAFFVALAAGLAVHPHGASVRPGIRAGGARDAPSQGPPAPSASVSLDSTPPGAEVYENGTALGRTPIRAVWTGERADPHRSHVFVFRLAGHAEATLTLAGRDLRGTASLEALPVLPPPVPLPSVPPSVRSQAPVTHRVRSTPRTRTPDGYRTDPYGNGGT